MLQRFLRQKIDMQKTQLIMGMPVKVEVVGQQNREEAIQKVFAYFQHIDRTFSTYKKDSEISRLNAGQLLRESLSQDVVEILKLAEDTKVETDGYFDIDTGHGIDPSGIVKGWAIYNAAELLKARGISHFLIDAGGDIQVSGKNKKGDAWRIGIRNPLNQKEIVKVLTVQDAGVATSGTYSRGQHVYNPHARHNEIQDILSLTVVGPTVYDADRFATAAFAMGKNGIHFIEKIAGFEGYMIDKAGIAISTTGFKKFVR